MFYSMHRLCLVDLCMTEHHPLWRAVRTPKTNIKSFGICSSPPAAPPTPFKVKLFALQGGFGTLSPLQTLNREFVATQLAVQQRGFLAIPGTLRLQLNCLNTSALPVTLSNGVRLTGESTLGDLLEQAKSSIINQRSLDMLILAGLLNDLNSSDPFGLCR